MNEISASKTHIEPTLDTGWWWSALSRGELLMPTCRTCNHRFFPPQPFCPNCGSENWYGAANTGLGKIYSWVVTHRAFSPDFSQDVPYANVAVDLDDGGRLIGRYFGDIEAIRDALPVRVKIYHDRDAALLGFEPVG